MRKGTYKSAPIEFFTPELKGKISVAKSDLANYKAELEKRGEAQKDVSNDPIIKAIINKISA